MTRINRPPHVVAAYFLLSTVVVGASLAAETNVQVGEGMKSRQVATPPVLGPSTVASSLPMGVIMKRGGQWTYVGKPPGVVHVPPCEGLGICLTSLNPEDVQLYSEIIARFGISRLDLANAPSNRQIWEYRRAGLFDNIEELVFRPRAGTWQAPTRFDALMGLDSLVTLEIVEILDAIDVSFLKDMENLRTLRLVGCPKVTGANAIGSLKNLRVLDLNNFPGGSDETMGIRDFDFLKSLSDLRSLRLDCQNGPKSMAPIAHLQGLRELSLRFVEFDKEASLEAMNNFRDLEVIALPTGMTDEQMAQLRAHGVLDKAVSIDLYGCGRLTTTRSLAGLDRLERLSLDGCEGLEDLACLESLPNLRQLSLMLVNIRDTNSFSRLQRLEEVTFSYNTDLVDISGLANLQNLKRITFDSNCGFLKDVSPLHSLKKIQYIDLGGCDGLSSQAQNALERKMPWCYFGP